MYEIRKPVMISGAKGSMKYNTSIIRLEDINFRVNFRTHQFHLINFVYGEPNVKDKKEFPTRKLNTNVR